MKIYNEIIQGSEEWHKIKDLHLSASEAQSIATAGKGLETLVTELMAQHLSTAPKETYSNKDLERGIELEAIAADIYELQEGVKLEKVGFVEVDEYTGCSPDRFIGKDGLWECKAVNDVNHYKLIRDGLAGVESKYIWQCQMQMLLTKRKYNQLCFYNPNFKQSLIIFKILPDKESFEKLKVGIAEGIKKIKEQLQK